MRRKSATLTTRGEATLRSSRVIFGRPHSAQCARLNVIEMAREWFPRSSFYREF